jgi:mannose-6-phosphate isomerase-like protein (cupin superfamily)
MAYHVVDPADIDPTPDRPSTMRSISDAADLDTLGLRVYAVDPGEDVPLTGMHYHDEQEEAFYVVDGTLAVETPEETYEIEAGQFFVAEPRSPHRAHNPASARDSVHLIAVGAPSVDDWHAYDG